MHLEITLKCSSVSSSISKVLVYVLNQTCFFSGCFSCVSYNALLKTWKKTKTWHYRECRLWRGEIWSWHTVVLCIQTLYDFRNNCLNNLSQIPATGQAVSCDAGALRQTRESFQTSMLFGVKSYIPNFSMVRYGLKPSNVKCYIISVKSEISIKISANETDIQIHVHGCEHR